VPRIAPQPAELLPEGTGCGINGGALEDEPIDLLGIMEGKLSQNLTTKRFPLLGSQRLSQRSRQGGQVD